MLILLRGSHDRRSVIALLLGSRYADGGANVNSCKSAETTIKAMRPGTKKRN